MIKNHWQSMLLLNLFFLYGQLSKQGTQAKGCPTITENSTMTSCDCYSGELKCRVIGTNSTISIRIPYYSPAAITCAHLDFLDYNLLPNFTESRCTMVKILHCPIPSRQPIHRIFSKLGMTNVHELEFESGGALQRTHFEGLQNLRALSINSNDTPNLPEDLFADLGNLIELKLRNNIDLPLNILSSLENLKSLSLKNNSLHDLPPGIFQNKNKLAYLKLEGNNLINLTEKAFEEVSSIIHLDLSSNRIVTLFPDVFSSLPHLETLILKGNDIQSLPDGLFAFNKNLVSFQLYENRVQLKRLPGRLLGNLPNLKVVRLSCGLETIPDDVLINSREVWTVTISENNLTELPHKLFTDQIELLFLDLSRNQLVSLPDGFFQNTKKLRTLRLSHNHLVTIANNIFDVLHHLRDLFLDNNNITTINNFDLKTDVIVHVNLTHNSIQKIVSKGECCSLQIMMDLSHNPINCDCELLAFVQFLKSKNATLYIEWLGDSLDMFQCRYPQDLEARKVSQLSPTELICPLDRDSSSVQLCPENCSCWVRAVDGVAVVNCSNADLTEMPILPNINLPQLNPHQIHGTELHIENNRLTQLPDANTPGYMHVVELHASNNSLAEVLAINLPKNLTLLDLPHNKIQHLHDTTLSVLNGGGITVSLAGNPWTCDCSVRGLLGFVLLNSKITRDFEQMECVDGQKFEDLSLNMICSAKSSLRG